MTLIRTAKRSGLKTERCLMKMETDQSLMMWMRDMTTIHLSIDGDHACALLGENLQEGEAEFVKVDDTKSRYSKNIAARKALKALCDRLGKGQLGYYVGEGVASPLAMRNPDDR